MTKLQAHNEHGFTLVELLVALALLVVLTAILLQALSATTEVAARSLDQARQVTIENARRFLQRAIEQTVVPHKRIKGDRPVWFSGDPARVEFISRYTVIGQLGGMKRYRLYLDSQTLMLQWASYRANVGRQNVSWRSEILLQDVGRFELRYLNDGTWHDTWTHPWLPTAISINVVINLVRAHQKRALPPLVVRLELRRVA